MQYQTIQIEKLTPTLGAEIHGVDLSKPLTNEQFAEIRHAFLENLVIFFRDQHLTIEQQKAFSRRFGSLHVHPVKGITLSGDEEVIELKADEQSSMIFGEPWHQDATADEEPPLGTTLYIKKVPENGGGDTVFSSGYAAYEALSEPVKRMLEGLKAVHEQGLFNSQYFTKRQQGQSNAAAQIKVTAVQTEHPVVRVHPETHRKTLFVNKIFTTRIVGLAPLESRAILDMLFQQIEQDEFKCRFKWQPNSLAFWDNRVVFHRAIWDYYPQGRYGLRVTICGDRPM